MSAIQLLQENYVTNELVQEAMAAFNDDMKELAHRQGLASLIDYLNNSDFFTSPASAKNHMGCRCGLLVHSYHVRCQALKLMNSNFQDQVNREEVLVASWFHDINKTGTYKTYTKNAKFEGPPLRAGKFEWIQMEAYAYNTEDEFPMGHGEKSVFRLMKLGFFLTDSEMAAINYHMGYYHVAGCFEKTNSLQAAYDRYPLALLIHIADMLASFKDDTQQMIKYTPEEILGWYRKI